MWPRHSRIMSWWEHSHYHWARQTTAWTWDTFPDLLCVYLLNRWTFFITLAVCCSETLISGKIQERDYVVKSCWKTYIIARDHSPLWWALGKITQSRHRRLSMVSIQSHGWKYQRSMNCKSLGNTWWYNPAPNASGLTSSGKTCFTISYILSTRCLVVNNSLEDKRQSNPLRASLCRNLLLFILSAANCGSLPQRPLFLLFWLWWRSKLLIPANWGWAPAVEEETAAQFPKQEAEFVAPEQKRDL